MKWKPIDTAPKNGTHVLCCEMLMDGYVMTPTYVVYQAYYRDYDHLSGWVLSNYVWPDECEKADPTHWMPLPEPPEVK